ncbi:MAG TPA: site-specific DNA-methyltransferase [Pyrinomonadaceae bacterium]|jgi:adenine-specific DNA-methyltransferase
MARKKNTSGAKPIEQYTHADKDRMNNPPVGLVTPETDKEAGKRTYAYDPHLDPQLHWDGKPDQFVEELLAAITALESEQKRLLSQIESAISNEQHESVVLLVKELQITQRQLSEKLRALQSLRKPYLNWAGKAEHTSFAVPTVSLHVHERIDPRNVIEAVRRKHEIETGYQTSLFESEQVNLPLFKAVEFYKHRHNWANRLIAGDSLLVMNSLLVKEGMAGSVQMVYFDPPYGIKYGSNFQPFVNKRDVKDGRDEDLTAEPETLKAFRDTWELGIHSYLTYLRDRLLLARELLQESGSIFVQISDENLHLVRNLLDEVFGVANFVSLIPFVKMGMQTSQQLGTVTDFLLWFAKDIKSIKSHKLYTTKALGARESEQYSYVEMPDKTRRRMTSEEQRNPKLLPEGARTYLPSPLISDGWSEAGSAPFTFKEQTFEISRKHHWKTSQSGLQTLADRDRLIVVGNTLRYIRYLEDFPATPLNNLWTDTAVSGFDEARLYVVQTSKKVIERCILMATDPGDLVLDITCGSGTTAYVAEQWGRRWITCDTSRVALTLTKQRLMTATFDYYQLAKPEEGIASGFKYETVPHITLKSIANNEKPTPETLYDKPLIEKYTARVTSPFTVEAVPAPIVQPLHEATATEQMPADNSIARSGETLRQDEWRSELLRTGIRGRRGEKMLFSRVEPLAGTRFLHADAEVMNETGGDTARAVVSFAPEHEPMPPAQVELALMEANKLFPKPKFVIFAAFQFDPVAVNNIEQTNWQGVQLLKAQMNADMLTDDLKKSRSSNESFWLIGQPDVQLREAGQNERGEKQFQVEVVGFDYYNVKEGTIESGGTNRIAVWMLDTNFDGRSIFPHQVFFPMAGDKEGWARLARNLKSEINEDLIEAYRGNVSLPFTTGSYKRIAVKIVDDRGIESLKLIDVQ